MITREEAEQCVDNSIVLLDLKYPEWREGVDTKTLVMSDSQRCLLAQVGRKRFNIAANESGGFMQMDMFLDIPEGNRKKLAFHSECSFEEKPMYWAIMQEVWTEKLS